MFVSLKTATLAILCSALLISGSVTAATTTETWNFKFNASAAAGEKITLKSKELDTKAIMSGWTTQTSSNTATVVSANRLVLTSSLGVQIYNNHDTHGVDNINGFDFILLEFPNPTELISLTNTWSNQPHYDWVSVGAFNSNPFANGVVNWTQVAKAATVAASYTSTGANTPFIFAQNNAITPEHNIKNVTSKFWLIGAYNPIFNGGSTVLGDILKFGSITTKTTTTTPNATPVPTPGTLSLFAIAMIGLSLSKRRKK